MFAFGAFQAENKWFCMQHKGFSLMKWCRLVNIRFSETNISSCYYIHVINVFIASQLEGKCTASLQLI